jgi:hypothetical protein
LCYLDSLAETLRERLWRNLRSYRSDHSRHRCSIDSEEMTAMKIYRHTPDYLEIRATDRVVVLMTVLFSAALLLVGACLVYLFRFELADFPTVTGATIGLLLVAVGGSLLFLVSWLTTFSLTYYFDKELGLFCFTTRTLLQKKVIRRSIYDIWQLWVDGEPDLMGKGHHHITIVMNDGEQIKIPNLGSTPIEQEFHENLAYEIGEFLADLPDVAV